MRTVPKRYGKISAVPTNRQRRATAKRKLERQLERRAKQAKRRRQLLIIGAAVAAVAVIAAIVVVVVNNKDHKGKPSASTKPSSSAAPSRALPPVQLGNAVPLPPFRPSATLGANCQYPPSPDQAGKPVKPPHIGKVSTEPAQISVSMVTNQGNVGLMLANNESPCTVNSFANLAGQDFFKDTKCHRLVTSAPLSVLQCGSTKEGAPGGGPGYQFDNEYPTDQYPPNDPKLKQAVIYPRGTLAMANAGPNTNASEFFMVYRDSALPPEYTIFGTIQADGLATLDKIAQAGVAGDLEDGPPAIDVIIKSVRLD
jgi:peptidyl-prolyl cis-trans isomerase B (cyclophilin B)